MFNSVILDVGIGLIFAFLSVSLVSSAVTEAVASALKWRSTTLLDGIKSMLNDPNFQGLAKELYNNALVNPRGDGTATSEKDLKNAPAYVDAAQFANAFTEILKLKEDSPVNMKDYIDKNVADSQIKKMLIGMIDRTNGKLDKINDEIATWFDHSMDRVSGVYKRKAQLWTFLTALILAVILNADAIQIAGAIWKQPSLVKSLSASGTDTTDQALQKLDKYLPVGWPEQSWPTFLKDGSNLDVSALQKVLGWVITALATLFGAAFWFDALQRVSQIKGAGPSPAKDSS